MTNLPAGCWACPAGPSKVSYPTTVLPPPKALVPLGMTSPPIRESGFEIFTSRQFPAWLAGQNAGLAFTTYQTGTLFLVGLKLDGRLSVHTRSFNRAMGLWSDGQTLWLGTAFQLWHFENLLEPGQRQGERDRLYAPLVGYTTGDVDIHDIAALGDGHVVFVNTLFSCLASPDPSQSFRPLWQPPFISRLAPEDRCHLNGLALRDGGPAFVTCVSRSDAAAGWRDRRADGGVVVEVDSGEVVLAGLSMPHSPRWYRDTLYVLNSGAGEFGRVDLGRGAFEPIAFVPGYLRGLAFLGDYAVIGASKPRQNRSFTGLTLEDNLRRREVEPRCGLYIVDLANGTIVNWLNIEGALGELYDVAILPGVGCPAALGFKTEELHRTIKLGPQLWTAQPPPKR